MDDIISTSVFLNDLTVMFDEMVEHRIKMLYLKDEKKVSIHEKLENCKVCHRSIDGRNYSLFRIGDMGAEYNMSPDRLMQAWQVRAKAWARADAQAHTDAPRYRYNVTPI